MRLKIDENLPDEAANLLVEAGHDAMTVLTQRMGGATDPRLNQVCIDENRVLVTLDLDFANIRVYPPGEHSGIIILRASTQSKTHILSLLQNIIHQLSIQDIVGSLWIVDETGIRIRGKAM